MDCSKGKKKRCAYRPCPSITALRTSYFVFPKDPERAATWLKLCNRQDLLSKDPSSLHKNYVLCEKHFENKYISLGGQRKRLFENAIPTLFLNNLHLKNIEENKSDDPIQETKTHVPALLVRDVSTSVEAMFYKVEEVIKSDSSKDS